MKMKFFSANLSPQSFLSPLVLIFFSLYVLLVFSSTTCEGKVKLPKNVTVPAVIVFGDSIVDQGNNNNLRTLAKCNFLPYGKDFPGGIPTGRFTNGKTPADLIAEELGIKELVPAYLDPNLQAKDLPTGVSFASGGTGFDPQTSQTASVLSLSNQIDLMKEYIGKLKGTIGEEGTQHVLAESIYLVVAGSDDLVNTYFTLGLRRLQYDIKSYTDLLVQHASNFVQELHKLGARRIAVFGIPPVGCVPSQRTLAGGRARGCAENYNQAAQLFNTKLSSALHSLIGSLSDPKTRIVYINIYDPLLDLIQNHDKYGFSIVDKGCCGTGTVEVVILCNELTATCTNDSTYLFWDSFHPTERGYRLLVTQLLQNYVGIFL